MGASYISQVSMIRVSGMEDDEVTSKNGSSSVVSAVMVEPSSTPRSVPDGIITNTPPHTPYQRRSSNGSIKRLSFESGLSKCDESIEETAESSQGEDVPKKRDSKVRFQAANIDVVDEKEDLSTDSDVDLETMSALASLTSAASGGGGGGGGGADGGADGGTTTPTTSATAAVVGKKNRNNSSSFVELSTVLSKLTTQMEADQQSAEERAQRTDDHILRLQEEATTQQKMMVQLFQNFQQQNKEATPRDGGNNMEEGFYPVLDDGDVELWKALKVIRRGSDISCVAAAAADQSEGEPAVVQPSSSSLLLSKEEDEEIPTEQNNNGMEENNGEQKKPNHVVEEVVETTKEESTFSPI